MLISKYFALDPVVDFQVECYPYGKYSVSLAVLRNLNDAEKHYCQEFFKGIFGNRVFIFERLINLEEKQLVDARGKVGFLANESD